MTKTINLKQLGFTVKFNGDGCVNYDQDEQKSTLYNYGIRVSNYHDNNKFAKKHFCYDGNGGWGFKYAVSSGALRHNVFSKEIENANNDCLQIPYVYYNMIAQPCMIERGYFNNIGSATLHRTGCLTMCDAEEDIDTVRTVVDMCVCSSSGHKVGKTSLFYKENVGRLTYIAKGFIDLHTLEFIPMDDKYGRLSVRVDVPEYKKIFCEALKRNFPTLDATPKDYYQKNGRTNGEDGEYGILFDAESVNNMTKDMIRRIWNISIRNANGMLETESVKFYYKDENGNRQDLDITPENIDEYFFNVISDYEEVKPEIMDKAKVEYQKYLEESAKKKAEEDKANKKNK